MSAARDYIEPIVGWRTRLVVCEGEGLRLRSVVYDTPWFPHNELIARCLRHRAFSLPWRRRSGHVPPGRGCGCGIYAAREPAEAASYLEGPQLGREVALALTDYDVPVELLDADACGAAKSSLPPWTQKPPAAEADRAKSEHARFRTLALWQIVHLRADAGVPTPRRRRTRFSRVDRARL